MLASVLIAVFIGGLYFLYRLQAAHRKYATRVYAGLGLGVIFGAALQLVVGGESETVTQVIDWIAIVGSGYVRLLQLLVIPLIVVSLIRAFTRIESDSHIGKISGSVIGTLIATVSISAILGIVTTLVFNLDGVQFVQGEAESQRIAQLVERQAQVADLSIPQQIINFIPSNIFEDLSGSRSTSTIAVVIFSALVGLAYLGIRRKDSENADFFKKLIDSLYAIVSRLVTLVLRLAPYGIFALMTKTFATSSVATLLNLGVFIVASYVAIAVMFVIHGLILQVVGVNPIRYFKKVLPVLSFAFTSRSSGGTLPLTIETQTKALGVDEASANFAGTFGLSIGQNGCAGIYPAMLAAIVAPQVGLDLSDPITWVTLIVTIAISSFGVAGVGGGATFASLIVFGTLGLPVEIIGLMVSVEPVIDMARTALNVNDSILAGVVASKSTQLFDQSVFEDDALQVVAEV